MVVAGVVQVWHVVNPACAAGRGNVVVVRAFRIGGGVPNMMYSCGEVSRATLGSLPHKHQPNRSRWLANRDEPAALVMSGTLAVPAKYVGIQLHHGARCTVSP